MFFQNYLFKKNKYPMLLNATLDVTYVDCRGQIPVTIVQLSESNALIHTDHIILNKRHLLAFEQKPVLTLKMMLPEGTVEERIHICWYKWSTDSMAFEIFIEFERSIKKEKRMITKALKRIQRETNAVDIPN